MTTLAEYLSMIGENSLSSLNVLIQSFLGGERPLALDVGK